MSQYLKRLISSVLIFSVLFTQIASGLVYAQSTTYSYDANGNVISDGSECYVYNDANQVSEVRSCGTNQLIAEYKYDHAGQRGLKKLYENGVLASTVYTVGDHYETKIASDSSRIDTTYYRVNDELVARKDGDGSKYFYHNDHLQSSSVVTDASGSAVEETKYEPYGEVLAGGTQGKYQFTGQERDSETSLAYYGARYYDPELKRFIQPDSILPNPYDPQQLNRYAYVRNNPVNNTDPSGHCATGAILDTIACTAMAGGLTVMAASILSMPINIFGMSMAGGANWKINGSNNVWDGFADGAKEGYRASLGAARTIFDTGAGIYLGGAMTQEASNVNKALQTGGTNSQVSKSGSYLEKQEASLQNHVPNQNIVKPYLRPSSTTFAQRNAVNYSGASCVNCGVSGTKMYADHKTELVVEYYQSGKIDVSGMNRVEAVQPMCPTCSSKQGAFLSRYSIKMKELLGF